MPFLGRMDQEILSDISTKMLQDNVSKEFNNQRNTGITSGCISGDKVLVAENTWTVNHSLGREAIGFMIIEQGSTVSLLCEMTDMTTTTSKIKFSGDPTSFTLFFY